MGIVGNKKYNEAIFLESIRTLARKIEASNDFTEIFLIFEEIPIKIKIFLTECLEEVIDNYRKIQDLNIIIFTVDLFDIRSIEPYDLDLIEKFNEIYLFQGISILIGLDIAQIFKNKISKKFKVSRFSLENKAKDLNLTYCYEIYNKTEDIIGMYNKIFNDFLFRFRYSSPELYKQARTYGKELLKENSLQF